MPSFNTDNPCMRVGILHSQRGTMAISEAPLVEAELMAIAEINQSGGVLGQRIEAIVEDGASQSAEFESKARKLIQEDQVATVFGCWTSASRKAVLPVFEVLNSLLWYPLQYEGLECSPNIFYTGSCPNQQIEPAVNWLVKNYGKRFYLIGSDYIFPLTANKIIKAQLKQLGGTVVGEDYISLGTQDIGEVITKIKQVRPDVVFNTLNGDSNVAFYRQYKSSGITADDIPIMAVSVAEAELQRIGDTAAGHYASWSYFQSLDTPNNQRFVENFQRRYGANRVTSDPIEAAYAQVYLWKQAVESAQSFEVDRVRVAAYGQKFDAPGGLIQIEPNHHIGKECRIGRILPTGQFEIVFTSERPIKPLPWLGVETYNCTCDTQTHQYNQSSSATPLIEPYSTNVVIELLAEVAQWIEKARYLETNTQALEMATEQLKHEILERQRIEAELQKAFDELELKVEQRTADLKASNAQLMTEVRERQEAQEELRAAKDQLQAVLEAVPGIVSWINSDLQYLGVNRHLAKTFNLPSEGFVGQDIGFLQASSEFNDFVKEFFATPEQDACREVSAIVNDEKRNYVIVAQKYHQGSAAFTVGIDITERQQALDDLRKTKDQLQAVLEAVPGIVSWISSDLRYLGVNRHLAKTFNLPPEAFVGQDIGFLQASSEFNDFVKEFFASSEQDASREVSAIVNDEKRNYVIVAQKYHQGSAAFTIGIDISERRQAEEALRQAEVKYRNIFENAVEGIFQTTPSGGYLSANPALARIYGYESPEVLINTVSNIEQQLYVDPNRRSQFIQLLEENGMLVDFESQVYRQDGSLTWICENARVIKDEYGNLLYYEGTVEDISERKQAQEALQKANEVLETRVEERTAALRDANHQLRIEIVERMHIEAALRKSEAELRVLFGAMTDVITVFDAQGRYMKVVSTNSEVLYSPTTELLGKSVYEVLPPKQAELFVTHIRQVLDTKQTLNIEYSLPIGNYELGSIKDAISSKSNLNGQKLSDFDSENIVHQTNKSCHTLSDYEKLSDFNGQKLVGQTDKPFHTSHCTPHNSQVWFAASVSPLPNNCVIWVARNITERKRVLDALQEAEEKYRSIFENVAEGIFQITPDGQYLSVNPALARMYGYSCPEEIVAKVTDIEQQLYVNPNSYAEFIAAVEEHGAISDFEARVYRQDGKIIWTSQNARFVRDAEGKLLYYEGTVADITKRKQAEAALRAEQEKSEHLLLNILPHSIAQRLKQEPKAIANRFDEVTILFADIVEFTKLSARISPTELVNLLNQIFSSFDQLAQHHGLEKIKTIGDAYMVVGGLPNPRDDHPEAIANMALDMQQEISRFQRHDGEAFRLRIGINTGPVVAGVIGIQKFIYDLWGDAVNVASRMDSQGEPGKIQVTANTYERLRDKYLFEERGIINVKGKGEMITYWLTGRK